MVFISDKLLEPALGDYSSVGKFMGAIPQLRRVNVLWRHFKFLGRRGFSALRRLLTLVKHSGATGQCFLQRKLPENFLENISGRPREKCGPARWIMVRRACRVRRLGTNGDYPFTK